jgi:type IV secretory pathway VirB4 component
MVIDPENEYKALCEKLGGTYISLSTTSDHYINPFDLPPKGDDREYGPGDLLRGKILDLI